MDSLLPNEDLLQCNRHLPGLSSNAELLPNSQEQHLQEDVPHPQPTPAPPDSSSVSNVHPDTLGVHVGTGSLYSQQSLNSSSLWGGAITCASSFLQPALLETCGDPLPTQPAVSFTSAFSHLEPTNFSPASGSSYSSASASPFSSPYSYNNGNPLALVPASLMALACRPAPCRMEVEEMDYLCSVETSTILALTGLSPLIWR